MLKWISVDGLSALILLLIAFVATTAAIYLRRLHGTSKSETVETAALLCINYNLFVFSMLAIPVLAEPTLVWIVVELTTLCSALLVSFENTREALEAAWKYVVLSLMGAGMALFGFLVLFAAMQASGSNDAYTWNNLITAAPSMPPVLLQTAFLLILIGLGTKVGLVPMHTWLPDAHSQAPSPVCALLSGIETSAILYVILRLFPVMQASPQFPCRNVGAGSRSDLGRHRRVFAAASARLQTHVRFFHRRAHGHYFGGGRPRRVSRRL